MFFENIPCKAFSSAKNGVWNDPKTMWDSFQTSNAENLPCIVSENCYACIRSSLHTHVESCIRKLILVCA